jgi:hypothetical protein
MARKSCSNAWYANQSAAAWAGVCGMDGATFRALAKSPNIIFSLLQMICNKIENLTQEINQGV